jgi:hypothetical protein
MGADRSRPLAPPPPSARGGASSRGSRMPPDAAGPARAPPELGPRRAVCTRSPCGPPQRPGLGPGAPHAGALLAGGAPPTPRGVGRVGFDGRSRAWGGRAAARRGPGDRGAGRPAIAGRLGPAPRRPGRPPRGAAEPALPANSALPPIPPIPPLARGEAPAASRGPRPAVPARPASVHAAGRRGAVTSPRKGSLIREKGFIRFVLAPHIEPHSPGKRIHSFSMPIYIYIYNI